MFGILSKFYTFSMIIGLNELHKRYFDNICKSLSKFHQIKTIEFKLEVLNESNLNYV